MAALLLDFVNYFVSKNIIAGDGIDAFRDFIPDNIVAFHEYKGDPPSVFINEVHRSVQISVRNVNADAARVLAQKLYLALVDDTQEDGRITLTDTRWGQLYLREPPYKISQDKSDRVTYGFNLGITTTIE